MNSELRKQFHDAYIEEDKNRIGKLLGQDPPYSVIKFCNGSYQEDGKNIYLDALRSNTLWLSSPNQFNDPFDCALNTDYEQLLYESAAPYFKELFGDKADKVQSKPEVQQSLHEAAMNIRSTLQERDQSVKDNIFVSCFSEKENWKSLRMWGHYANCHRGFCLEYDFRQIHRVHKKGMIPILYKQNYSLQEPEGNATSEDFHRFYLDVAFTKALEWEYEKEWRLLEIEEQKSGKDGFSLPFIKPTSVYIGCKASNQLKKDLKAICAKQGIQLFQMEMKPGSFDLTYEKLPLT